MYDLQGRIVETLISNRLNPGKHSITFDASSYSSGTYFIQTMIDGLNQTKKVKHHLYGIVTVKKHFSAGDWLKHAKRKIDGLC